MVQVITGDSQEEVIIFRDRQTDRQTLHHNIYIIATITIITLTMWVVESREILLVIRLAKWTREGREEGGPENKSSFGR